MAKSPTKKDDGDISTSKIYEILQSGGFLEALWWDMIKDIKEKPAYKQMIEMVEKLITKQSGIITSVPTNDAENLRRRAVITEICSMNYTVDTVFSKILYTRLQKKLPFIIDEMVAEVKQKLKISPFSDSPSAGKNIETSSGNQPAISPEKKKSSASSGLETNGESKRKRGRPRKDVYFSNQNTDVLDKSQNNKTPNSSNIQRTESEERLPKESDSLVENKSSNVSKSVKIRRRKGRPRKCENFEDDEISDKNTESPDSSSKKEMSLKTSKSPIKKAISTSINDSPKKKETTINNNRKEDEEDSDNESGKFSFGNLSFTSVSSVHTSELSSYDDEISLSDGEQGTMKKKKKRLSVNEIKQMLFKESVSDQVAMKMAASKRTSRRTKMNGSTKEIDIKNTHDEIKAEISKIINMDKEKPKDIESDEEQADDPKSVDSPQKSLPRRIRKPNSKYSSSNIICSLTNVQPKRINSSVNGNQDSESESTKMTKKFKAEESNITKESPRKSQENGSEEVKNSPKTPSKSQSSLDSFKPRPTVSNLTTRRSAPITLFSTATDKKS